MSKLVKNGAFYMVERFVNIGFTIVSGMLIARTFGPSNIGKLAYIQSISGMLMMLPTLGFDHFVVRDIVNKKDEGGLLGTVFTLQGVGWILYVLMFFIIIAQIDTSSESYILYLIVVSTTLFTRLASISLYFQAKQRPDIIARATITSRALALVFVVISIANNASFITVANYLLIQSAVLAVIQLISYQKNGIGILKWNFDYKRAKDLARESWPFIISGMIFPIYMNSDILMIEYFMDDYSVGLYSVAMKLMTQLNFVGYIITILLFPKIIKLKENKKEEFRDLVLFTITILLTCALLGIIGTVVVSDFVVTLFYGAEFYESASILNVLTLVWLFLWPATLFTRLLVLEKATHIELAKTTVAAIANVLFNMFMIPKYGLNGAAIASVSAYAISDLFMYACFQKTRWFVSVWFLAIPECLKFMGNYRRLKVERI